MNQGYTLFKDKRSVLDGSCILNHLGLKHLSGVKGGCPLEEAYYLKLSLFQGVEYFF
jgi:hypothetical protein